LHEPVELRGMPFRFCGFGLFPLSGIILDPSGNSFANAVCAVAFGREIILVSTEIIKILHIVTGAAVRGRAPVQHLPLLF
jgi:hypothetical protein